MQIVGRKLLGWAYNRKGPTGIDGEKVDSFISDLAVYSTIGFSGKKWLKPRFKSAVCKEEKFEENVRVQKGQNKSKNQP